MNTSLHNQYLVSDNQIYRNILTIYSRTLTLNNRFFNELEVDFFLFLILEKFQYFRVNRFGILEATRKVRNQFRHHYYRAIRVKPFRSSCRERTTNFPMRLKSWTRKSVERQGAIITVYSSRCYAPPIRPRLPAIDHQSRYPASLNSSSENGGAGRNPSKLSIVRVPSSPVKVNFEVATVGEIAFWVLLIPFCVLLQHYKLHYDHID